jgi:hypothetical protein
MTQRAQQECSHANDTSSRLHLLPTPDAFEFHDSLACASNTRRYTPMKIAFMPEFNHNVSSMAAAACSSCLACCAVMNHGHLSSYLLMATKDDLTLKQGLNKKVSAQRERGAHLIWRHMLLSGKDKQCKCRCSTDVNGGTWNPIFAWLPPKPRCASNDSPTATMRTTSNVLTHARQRC